MRVGRPGGRTRQGSPGGAGRVPDGPEGGARSGGRPTISGRGHPEDNVGGNACPGYATVPGRGRGMALI